MTRKIIPPQEYAANDESRPTLAAYDLSPDEVQSGDMLGYKVIAVVDEGGHFWTAYRGYTSWSDNFIREHGDTVSKEVAEALFYPLAARDDLKYYSR